MSPNVRCNGAQERITRSTKHQQNIILIPSNKVQPTWSNTSKDTKTGHERRSRARDNQKVLIIFIPLNSCFKETVSTSLTLLNILGLQSIIRNCFVRQMAAPQSILKSSGWHEVETTSSAEIRRSLNARSRLALMYKRLLQVCGEATADVYAVQDS